MSESVRSFDRITIPAPCDANWDSMIGNEQVRFCEHCNLHVTNLSSLTRQEAMRLVARSEGRLCVRYIQRPGGGILTKQVSAKLYPITRRISRIAAGAFTATLSLSSAAAQTPTRTEKPRTGVEELAQGDRQDVAAAKGSASLSGVVMDPNDAVVAGATITLILSDSQREQTTSSSEAGEFSFSSLSQGEYTLTVSSPGFKRAQITSIQLCEGSNLRVDPKLELGAISMGGAVVIIAPAEPLVRAVFEDDLETVSRLAFSSSVNVRDKSTNMTALEQAIENGNLEIVRILLLAGANAKTKNEAGRTPLMYLSENATTDIVRALLGAGAKVNARDESGGTALMNVASQAKYGVVKELIEAGAKIDVEDADGKTALMFAATNEDPKIAKLLIDSGARINVKAHDGKTALMFAADEGDPETVKLLISFSADINEKDDDGKTALMFAASTTDAVSVEALLNAGADLTAKDKDGKTALALAREGSQKEIVKLLESRGAPE
jgi:ankyrin repeat protein